MFRSSNRERFPIGSLRLVTGGTTLTIGAGMTVHGQNGTIGYLAPFGGPANVSVVKPGTISDRLAAAGDWRDDADDWGRHDRSRPERDDWLPCSVWRASQCFGRQPGNDFGGQRRNDHHRSEER